MPSSPSSFPSLLFYFSHPPLSLSFAGSGSHGPGPPCQTAAPRRPAIGAPPPDQRAALPSSPSSLPSSGSISHIPLSLPLHRKRKPWSLDLHAGPPPHAGRPPERRLRTNAGCRAGPQADALVVLDGDGPCVRAPAAWTKLRRGHELPSPNPGVGAYGSSVVDPARPRSAEATGSQAGHRCVLEQRLPGRGPPASGGGEQAEPSHEAPMANTVY
ncbi:hypothetical protein ACQJBY_025615 [Aegilops geniculata]